MLVEDLCGGIPRGIASAVLVGRGFPAEVVFVSSLGGAWGDGGENAPGDVIVVDSVKQKVCVSGLFASLGGRVWRARAANYIINRQLSSLSESTKARDEGWRAQESCRMVWHLLSELRCYRSKYCGTGQRGSNLASSGWGQFVGDRGQEKMKCADVDAMKRKRSAPHKADYDPCTPP